MKTVFYIVDVFAERKYAGNQLAVFRDAGGIPEEEMQQLAREMNYSETTFILGEREVEGGGYDVRIFSLDEELPFAGHPTLGTAYIIQRELIGEKTAQVVLNLPAGKIPVTFTYRGAEPDLLFMRQLPPSFGRRLEPSAAAAALSLDTGSIDTRYPVEEVSTGLPFIIVPLKTLQDVKRSQINRESCLALTAETEAKSILVFCPETYRSENDINVRVFDDYHGIPEDPATGSANGCLAGYLVKHRYCGAAEINLRVEQGCEIGRPSLLLLQAEQRDAEIAINVGGKVIMVARGEVG